MKYPRFIIAKAGAVVVLALALGASLQSFGQVYTLTDLNSSASINLDGSNPNIPVGMYNWSVQGQNQLQQQWFWYRLGNTREQSIDTISSATVNRISDRSISIGYSNPGQFGVDITYLLTGGALGSRVSDILETIKISNLGSSALGITFFQYSNFDLQGSADNDGVRLGRNLRGLFNEARQVDSGLPEGPGLSETVTTPGANHGEVGVDTYTFDRLNDAYPTVLNDGLGSVHGDVTWALQWDLTINPGASLVISKDKNLLVAVVPEPSAFALLGAGLAALAFRRRSR